LFIDWVLPITSLIGCGLAGSGTQFTPHCPQCHDLSVMARLFVAAELADGELLSDVHKKLNSRVVAINKAVSV
jgi:hypothetical protein